MQSNGSMNRVYRLVWNATTGVWQAVCECSKGRGKAKTSKPRATSLSTLIAGAFVLMPLAALAADLPTGGQVVAGSATITQSGSTMTVTQTTGKMAADWQSFKIGAGNTVNFVQPSAGAVALNRVLGSDVSVIQGALNANGQVFLVNPNGVLFTPTAQVNVGAIVASTLNLSTADFMAGNYTFDSGSRNADEGYSVINHGNITAHGENDKGGTIALIAAKIINTGSLTATGGNVLLGAGSQVLLDLGGPVKLQVTQGALNTLIEQGGAIRADGGLVYLTAKAAGDLAGSVINHTGITEARTLATGEQGEIVLLGDMAQGSVNVAGTLDASAPNGNNGGFIETSGHNVKVADKTQIRAGHWLIDPVDFTIGSGAGAQTTSGIGASTLASALGAGSVTIQTDASTGGNGDIFVNSAITWNAASKLTLLAHRNISINADITAQNSGGQLQFEYGQGSVAAGNTATYTLGGSKINLQAGDNFFTKLGSNGGVTSWKVITSLGNAGSTSGADLQGINGALSGNYVLGGDIDASATSTWNSGAGFLPIGTNATRFTARFDGLGHTISNLTINRASAQYVGLFGALGVGAMVQNLGLVGSNIFGSGQVGPLAGYNKGTVSNSYAIGSTYGGTYAGGLVGLNDSGGVIQNSYSTGSLRGGNRLGGLVGVNQGAVTDSYSFVSITDVASQDLFGGLVGHNNGGSITRSYATGLVNVQVPTNNAGALVGFNGGSISNSFWNTDTNSIYGLSGIGAGTATGSTGLTSAQMQALSTFASWDIDDVGGTGKVWRIYDGDSSPLLRSLLTPLTVTAVNDFETTYDGTAKSGGNGYVGGSADASKILYGGSSQGAKNVGNYGLYIYSNQSGYDVIGSRFSSNGLTITPAPLTVTANAASKTYDGATYSGGNGVTYSGFVNSETDGVLGGTLGYTGTSQGATNAGSYAITPGGLTSSNYTVSFVDGALSINKAHLTVTADNQTRLYGAANPSFTQTITGYVNSETSAVLSGSATGSSTATASTGVGTATIAGSTGTLSAINYDFTAANGTLTINPAALTVTANAATKTYDGAAYIGGNGVAYSGFVNSETDSVLGGTLGYSGTSQGATNAGSYAITPGGLTSSNYTVSFVDGALSINKAHLTVTADNQTRLYGAANPSFTQTITGYVNSETSAVLSGSATGSSTATASTGVGTATIAGSTGTLSATNYDFTAANGTLTIDPAALTLTANAASKTYDGAAYSGGNGVAYSGFVNSETDSVLGGTLGYSGTSQGATNAGSYAITPGGLTSSNYTVGFVDGALTISAPPPVVSQDIAQAIPQAAIIVATQAASQTVSLGTSPGTSSGGTAGGGTLQPNSGATAFSGVASAGAGTNGGTGTSNVSSQSISGGLALVEVADAPPAGQNTSTSNAGGFMTVFVVNGGINTGGDDLQPTTAR